MTPPESSIAPQVAHAGGTLTPASLHAPRMLPTHRPFSRPALGPDVKAVHSRSHSEEDVMIIDDDH